MGKRIYLLPTTITSVSAGSGYYMALDNGVKVPKILVDDFIASFRSYKLLYTTTTQAGTPASTSETTLASYTLPGGTLDTNGDYILVEASGSFGATGNDKRLKFKFGSTIIDTGVVTENDYNWRVSIKVYRMAAATQKHDAAYRISANSGSGLGSTITGGNPVGTASETLANNISIQVTGQSPTTGAANDVVLETMTVSHHKV